MGARISAGLAPRGIIESMPLRLLFCLWIVPASGLAQTTSDVLFLQNFQEDTGAWSVLGDHASVSKRADAPGMLFTYELAPKIFSGIVRPVPGGFDKMQRVRLRVKTDHATAMGVLLSEKKPGGGNYSAWFWSPANTWQTVEFTPADFTAGDGPGDPKDLDGKLDLGDVEGLGLFDLGQFFAQFPGGGAPITVKIDQGQHTAAVESFEVLSSPAAAPRATANAMPLDTLDRNFLDWVTLGGMDLKFNSGSNPLHAPALEASYEQSEGQLQLLLRRVSGTAMAGAKRLVFDVASEQEATLMLSLEMTKPGGGQGPRFTLPVYPPGGKEVFHVNLDLASFQGDGKFDPAKWRTIAIVDVTGASGGAAGHNTLWIGNVAVVKE
jgi:hypothetical protein